MSLRPETPQIPLERMSTEDVLLYVEPFMEADRDELRALARAATRRTLAAGVEIVAQGGEPDALYVVLRGRINLNRALAGPRELIVTSLGPGEVFGENCACKGARVSTSAVTAVTSEVLHVPAAALTGHLLRAPATTFRLMHLQSERLREAEAVASLLALCGVEERLAYRLARLAQRQGRRSSAGRGWVLAPVPTQSELARMVGTCRETVSRALGGMARSGLVSGSGRRMVVADALVDSLVGGGLLA